MATQREFLKSIYIGEYKFTSVKGAQSIIRHILANCLIVYSNEWSS